METSFPEFLNQLLRSKDLESLRELTAAQIGNYGFKKFSYLGLNPPDSPNRSVVESTYPEDWINEYRANQFIFLDPTLNRAKTSLLPFKWDGSKMIKKVNSAQKNFFHLGGDFGIKRGVVIPVHAPGGEFAAMAFATDEGLDELQPVWEHKKHELHMIGIYYHAAIWENILKRRTDSVPSLSPREVQCLQWSAKGKTAWETSEILGISEYTAKSYLKTAMEKLGTHNRVHAVSKALVYGLIKA